MKTRSLIGSIQTSLAPRALLAAAILALAIPGAVAQAAPPAAGAAPALEAPAGEDTNAKAIRDEPIVLKMMALSIPIVAIIMGCGIPIMALWSDYRKRHELIRMCHAERMAALEKGLEPPPLPEELLRDNSDADETKPRTPSPTPGIMWTLIGVGVLLWLWFSPDGRFHPSIAAIPIAIGVAYFLCFFYDRKREKTLIDR